MFPNLRFKKKNRFNIMGQIFMHEWGVEREIIVTAHFQIWVHEGLLDTGWKEFSVNLTKFPSEECPVTFQTLDYYFLSKNVQ